MTTYRMYRCDLCGCYLRPTDGPSKEGFGVHIAPQTGDLSFKRVHEADKHICHQCALGVHDELRKATPA